jgi:hypothetical protein
MIEKLESANGQFLERNARVRQAIGHLAHSEYAETVIGEVLVS